MNPMMRGVRPPMNPMQQIMQNFQKVKKDPNELTKLLKSSGRFSEDQLKAISGMNGDYTKIGQYLMGGVPQNMYGQIQNNVNGLLNQMK